MRTMCSGARCRRVAPVTLLSRVIAETVRGPPGARRAKYRSGASAACGCPLGAVSTHPGPAPSGWSPITARRRSSLASIGRDRADYLLPEGHWLFLCRYFLIIPLEILHSQFRGQGELHILAGAGGSRRLRLSSGPRSPTRRWPLPRVRLTVSRPRVLPATASRAESAWTPPQISAPAVVNE